MIITRTPLRISIGGGGTDLPSYYSRYGGFVISAAINRYIYITLHRTFRKTYIVKYSQLEEVERLEEIRHPIVRETFRLHGIEPYIEMVSMADIPAGTGLGSSSSFTVGLLKAVHAINRELRSTQELAEEACTVEIDLLSEPIGKQDQYIAAYGGLSCFNIEPSGKVSVSPLRVSSDTLNDLEENLLMFFTGYSRQASKVLEDQKSRSEQNDSDMLNNLHFVKETGLKIKMALEAGDTRHFAALMHEHWQRKKARSNSISNPEINGWYDEGVANGALGGKLIGAGGGGFLMFYAEDRRALRRAMSRLGLVEVRFAFDHEGSKVMARE